MKSAQLRQSILQAAVQGKLVPQNAHDEPASELLKRIQQEKARLVKEGKLKKKKPLSPVTEDEVPYDLPEGWVWCRICDSFIVNPRNSLPDDTAVSFIPMTLISSEYFGGHSQEERLWKQVRGGFTHFAENDVVIAKITPCFQNGKSCIMKNLKNGFGAGTTELHILRSVGVLPEYALIFAKNPLFLLDGEKNMTGTAGQQRVPSEFLENYPFPLPPLVEQQRIVAKVDELMALCDELEAAEKDLDKLEADFAEYLPKAILQAAVQGKLVPQNAHDEPASELLKRIQQEKARLVKEGKLKKEKPLPPVAQDEVPYGLPEGWVWCRLGDILNVRSSRRVLESDWRKQGIPFYRAREIARLSDLGYVNNDLYISEGQYLEYKHSSGVPQEGDLMVTAVGTLGKTYVVKSSDVFYYKDASVLCFNNFARINSEYAKYLMSSPMMEDQIKKDSMGTTVGTLTIVRANGYVYPLPPLAEQQRIVAKVDELMALCDELKAAKDVAAIPAVSNVVPFTVREEEDEREIAFAARGDAADVSIEAQNDFQELLRD